MDELEIPLGRHIPDRATWDQLTPTLTSGELVLADKFANELPDGWSVAVQRRILNALPDILCFHPKFGLIIVEVKDWSPDARNLTVRNGTIFADDEHGRTYISENPVAQVLHYRNILTELFSRFADAEFQITCVVAMTKFSDTAAKELLGKLVPNPYSQRKYAPYFIVAGSETLARNVNEWIIASSRRENQLLERYFRDRPLSVRTATRISWLLRVPELETEKYLPLRLDEQKTTFLRNADEAKRRKVMGTVGSGKSTLLAAYAAKHIAQGNEVLIISYTIVLRHWLHRLIVRAGVLLHAGGRSATQIPQHKFSEMTKDKARRWYLDQFVRELAVTAGRSAELTRLYRDSDEYPDAQIRELARSLVQEPRVKEQHRYKCILVDEMQNIHGEWLEILQHVLDDEGEFVVFADPAQNIYRTNMAWTRTMPGFPGNWTKLRNTYRFPPAICPMLRDFYDTFELKSEDSDPPEASDIDLFDAADLVWFRSSQDDLARVVAAQVRRSDELGFAAMDTAMLALNHTDGLAVLRELTGRDSPPQEAKGFAHIFHKDSRNAQHLKHAFWPMVGEKKLCTVHSFQGWEARYVVLMVSERAAYAKVDDLLPGSSSFDFIRTVYVGLSRLARSEQTAQIVVVNAERSLDEFFNRHFRLEEFLVGNPDGA